PQNRPLPGLARACLQDSRRAKLARFRITANATAEPAGQPHQVGVFERLIRSGQRPPPHTEPAWIMAHAEVGVQNNAIDAIVATAQQILIESAQPVRHGGQATGTLTPASNCPAGATFSQPGLRKSVGSYPRCVCPAVKIIAAPVAAAGE